MAFYDLPKNEREQLAASLQVTIETELHIGKLMDTVAWFCDEDTYVRKSAYLSVGRIYFANPELHSAIIHALQSLFKDGRYHVRQTTVNAAGEIGKKDFAVVQPFFDKGLFDEHHTVRNAVIGSVKKMGEVNPIPVLAWARQYLHHPDKEIRREICHGIELRGRKHPEDILPLLQELQHDRTARVRGTLVHVIGQIAYKKGCLLKVLNHLKTWENRQLVYDALEEIVDVHHRYRDFATLTQEEAARMVDEHHPGRDHANRIYR